ncbi:MAG: hypothetical protein R3D67_02325 [Hyphomicrobiaceae bacterium]
MGQQGDDQYLARNVVLFAKVRTPKGRIIGRRRMQSDLQQRAGRCRHGHWRLPGRGRRVAVRYSALEITEKDGKVSVVLPSAAKRFWPPCQPSEAQDGWCCSTASRRRRRLTDKTVETSKGCQRPLPREKAGPAMEGKEAG